MAALIVSIIALVLSVASISWQVWSWRRSGPVVSVTARQSLPAYDHGAGDWHVDVTARNTGRTPVQVTGWSFYAPSVDQAIHVRSPANWSTPLPHMLANGASASWYVPTSEIQRAADQLGVPHQQLRARVALGTGQTVSARESGIGLK